MMIIMGMDVLEYRSPEVVMLNISYEGIVCSSIEHLEELEGEW